MSSKTSNTVSRRFGRLISALVITLFLIGSILYLFEPWNNTLYNGGSPSRAQPLQEKSAKLRQRSSFHLWTDSSPDWLRKTYISKFLFVFYDGDTTIQLHQTIIQTLKALAMDQRKDVFSFVAVPSRNYIHQFQSFVDDEFEHDFWPSALILDVGVDVRKYVMPLKDVMNNTENTEQIGKKLQETLGKTFLDSYEKGTLTRYLRNEAIDYSQTKDEHGLISINSTRFQTIIAQGKQDKEFFIAFYAPWCGHCRRFEAAFNPIAKVLRKHTDKIGFYKMDATKNDIDHPEIEFNRVPHTRFLKAADKYSKPLVFDPSADELTLDYIKAFLRKHSMYYDEIKIAAIDEL